MKLAVVHHGMQCVLSHYQAPALALLNCHTGNVLYAGNEYHVRLNAGINAALARIKDYETDMRESLKQELMQSAELLDQAARLAMAAMLQVRREWLWCY